MRAVLPIATAACALTASPASALIGDLAGIDPRLEWKTLETEHFRVAFPEPMAETAKRAARYLEEAHRALSPLMRWEPRFRTQVVLVENSDAANGLTSATYRIGIVLIATPPDPWFSTAYYEDWLRLLCVHEYAHMLNLDVTRGIVYDFLRIWLGDLILPNGIWPTWMLEGLAVYMETRLTRAGRGRSPFYEMILRAAVEAKALDRPDFITLDRVNGPNPWFPGGETPYLFGYQLMNRVASDPLEHLQPDALRPAEKRTFDRSDSIRHGEDALGMMSLRSGGRFPFLINGNLENITGKTWYQYWDEWVVETRERAERDLDKIRSRPLTQAEWLTLSGYEVLGAAASPDGNWLAYAQESTDRRNGLHLRDLRTGVTRRLFDKVLGVGMAFTPDSRALVYSELERSGLYDLWSDLVIYDLERGKRTRISQALRARDPDVSPDGKLLAFTVTSSSTTGLAVAPLLQSSGDYRLGTVDRIYMPSMYDRVGNPKFSRDGRKVYFSLHRNGEAGEELAELDLGTRQVRTLLSDGRMNRFPAVAPDGTLHFVSDASGVDNLYRLTPSGKPELVTNVTTGIWLPTFGPSGAYASLYTARGWELAKLTLFEVPVPVADVAVSAPSAPQPAPPSAPLSMPEPEIRDYSVFPSILPRTWFPAFSLSNPIGFGGSIQGFDAIDRHRYNAFLYFDLGLGSLDWSVQYTNRALGPSLGFSSANTAVRASAENHIRAARGSISVSYPVRWFYATLLPSLSFRAERETLQRNNGAPISQSPWVPELESGLSYGEADSSRLAISQESGRVSILGARAYAGEGNGIVKGVLSNTEYWRGPDHLVLVTAARLSWTSAIHPTLRRSDVVVAGRQFPSGNGLADLLDALPLRGYPRQAFFARSAGIFSADIRLPLIRLYRGWGTNPLFLENLFGFLFAETAYFPSGDQVETFLPSVGGGLRLSTEILVRVPLTLTLQVNHGLSRRAGGRHELLLSLLGGNFEF